MGASGMGGNMGYLGGACECMSFSCSVVYLLHLVVSFSASIWIFGIDWEEEES